MHYVQRTGNTRTFSFVMTLLNASLQSSKIKSLVEVLGRIIQRTDVLGETECQMVAFWKCWIPIEPCSISIVACLGNTLFFFLIFMLSIQFLFFQTQIIPMIMFYSPAWWFLPKYCLCKFSLCIHIWYMHGSDSIWV